MPIIRYRMPIRRYQEALSKIQGELLRRYRGPYFSGQKPLSWGDGASVQSVNKPSILSLAHGIYGPRIVF